MFERILLPVDLTEKNDAAVDTARHLLGASGSAILLHVIETIADVSFEDLEDFYKRLEDKARASMSELAELLTSTGITVEQRVIYGKRAPEIVSFAQEKGIDLIVLDSHPLDAENPGAVWGSIGHQVAILARCPVLLLKT